MLSLLYATTLTINSEVQVNITLRTENHHSLALLFSINPKSDMFESLLVRVQAH